MSEIAKLLRLLVQADKEAKITALTVMPTVTEFQSQLASGEFRKSLTVYNHSDSNSGEIYYSYTKDNVDISGECMVIPKGAQVDIPVAAKLDENGNQSGGIQVYFFTPSGEIGNLRVEELS